MEVHTAFQMSRQLGTGQLTTGDAVGDLKSPSTSPFPFPGPSVACVEHRIELQVFHFTRMDDAKKYFSGCNWHSQKLLDILPAAE